MKARQILLVSGAVVLGLTIVAGASETRSYLLGDIDSFHYDGPGSVDDVYVDPDFFVRFQYSHEPNDDFDFINNNHKVPFTFQFPLAPGEQVVGATLTVALAGDSDEELLFLNADATTQWMFTYGAIGWNPISPTQPTVRSVDMADILGTSYLFLLEEGQLTAYINDDVWCDWARLDMEVIPEPATMSLLGLGGLALIRRRRR